MNWTSILFVIGAALFLWLAVRMIRNNPNLFTKEKLGKSLSTVGFLTLMVIAVIVFCVILLRN